MGRTADAEAAGGLLSESQECHTHRWGEAGIPTREAASMGKGEKEGSSKSVLLNHSYSHTARKYWWDFKYLSSLAWISRRWATRACTPCSSLTSKPPRAAVWLREAILKHHVFS